MDHRWIKKLMYIVKSVCI